MARLDELCTINMGQSPDSSTYNEDGSGLPFFQGNADFGATHPVVRMWCSEPVKRAQKEDILISVRAPIGALNIADGECCIGRGLAALTVNQENCIQKYLWYALSNKVAELNAKGTGSTFKAINKKILAETQIPLPPLDEQRKIAAVLDKVSGLIAKRRQQLDKLDLLVKSKFVEMFGDPVNNPKQWSTLSLRDAGSRLIDGPFGSNLKSEHYTAEGVRVIRLGNIGVGKFIDNDKSYISKQHYEKLKKYTCKAGEIVVATLGEPNLRACLVPQRIEYAINKADCVHYIPKKELLNTRFVCQYINCPETLLLASGMVHGQTRSRISSGQLAEMKIFVPPMELQEQFAAFAEQTEKTKTTISRNLEKLETLKKALMQEYFE